jgi:hypothetical protein
VNYWYRCETALEYQKVKNNKKKKKTSGEKLLTEREWCKCKSNGSGVRKTGKKRISHLATYISCLIRYRLCSDPSRHFHRLLREAVFVSMARAWRWFRYFWLSQWYDYYKHTHTDFQHG